MANDIALEMEVAAEVGDTDLLYTLIEKDQFVLEHFDAIPFVSTPLHIAASAGHLHFAAEIMILKPSFAWRLNQQGYSPIHLAIKEGHKKMVLRFVDIDKNLVRVKGRGGRTPLHLVSQNGDVDLLANFLKACPDSIEDVTVRSETALHIALKYRQYETLQVLVGWLQRNSQKDALRVEKSILNWKDEVGNTILHISTLMDDTEALDLLINATKMDLDTKNWENSTALDTAVNAEIKRKLLRAGAKCGSSVKNDTTIADTLKSKITYYKRLNIGMNRIRRNISEEHRSAYLIVAGLVATIVYPSALSPPGGVYQGDSGANNLSTTILSLNSTATSMLGNAGKSVMSPDSFDIILGYNVMENAV